MKGNANGKAFSKGKGMSLVNAGPKGSNAMAEGSEQTGVSTNFDNSNMSFEDSWGFMHDGKGNSETFGKKWQKNQKVQAGGQGGSYGEGRA